MFADPQTITINAGARTAPRVLTGSEVGRFVSPEQDAIIEVEHLNKGRRRSVVRLVEKKLATDPLTSINSQVNQSISLSINRPNVGFTEAEVLVTVKALLTWLSAGTDANLKKLIGGEN